ncbi:MAG: DUF697 domain-containing protein [Candidatus Electrothrix sp. AUS1_2]|nr:DUF697 domain-containing protein [Candidatus Electrothrix sp. AUS1_2]
MSGGDILERSGKIIENHVCLSIGIGLLPIPFLDFVAITGIQLNLIKKLAELYHTPFFEEVGKNIIGALSGGYFSTSIGSRILLSSAKTFPGIGIAVGAAGSAVVAGASTYALGRVFNRHFSEGGTFLGFDSDKARAFYQDMFQQGKEIVQTPSSLPKIFEFEKAGVMTVAGKIITGLDRMTGSKSTMFAINKGISKYGRLSRLDIDRMNRKISASIILKGENTTIEIMLEDYAIKSKGISAGIVFYKAASDKEWLTEILRNFVIGEVFEIPKGKEKIFVELLGLA